MWAIGGALVVETVFLLESLRSMMSATFTEAIVLLVTTGTLDVTRTSGSVVSLDCGKVNCSVGIDGEDEVEEYDPAGGGDVLPGGMEEYVGGCLVLLLLGDGEGKTKDGVEFGAEVEDGSFGTN